MRIGVYHVASETDASAQGYACARLMVQSVRQFMPTIDVVHFTDLDSPPIKGVKHVRRKPSEPMALLRMRHHAGVEGDWLFVDTDVVFQAPVSGVFHKATWDIGVTTRNWAHLKAADGFTERMPYNMGVVFSRSPQFWAECYSRLRALDADEQQWMGDQIVFNDAIASARYAVKRLSGAKYNFPPEIPGTTPPPEQLQAEAAILHYKGAGRKTLLIDQPESRRCA
jgi:hypothetical protein